MIALFRLGQALGSIFHSDDKEEEFQERALKRDDTFAYSPYEGSTPTATSGTCCRRGASTPPPKC